MLPAPAPEIELPQLPSRLSCDEVAEFSAPTANYSNGARNDECSISGSAPGVITEDYTVCGGSITITWTTSTGCDNQSIQRSVTIPVDGPDAPRITCPGPLTLDCDDPQLQSKIDSWLGSASAQTSCGATFNISNDYNQTSFIGGCSPSTGIKIVTFTVTDECGGSAICSAQIEIVDNNDPTWTIDPQPLTLECSDPDLDRKVQDWINGQGGGRATDQCSPAVSYSSDFRGFDRNCDGVTTVVFTAIDECDNRVDRTTTITIIDATEPEIINVGGDITVDCGEEYDFSNPTVSDNCDTNIGLEFSDSGISNACTGGVIIRTWTATDECGNTATAQQRVTISADNAQPTFTSTLPQDITVTCGNIPVAPIVEASDCNGATVSFVESDPAIRICGYTITRTWTATDGCGNQISHTQTINVDCPIEATISASNSVDCNNPNGGSATVVVSQGQPGYTYAWDNGETTATANNLSDGPHSVTITDASGCQLVLNVVIDGDFVTPTVTASGGQITCDNATVRLTASTNGTITGWTGPNGFATNLPSPDVSSAGNYTVTVIGDNGCTASADVVVTEDKSEPTVTAGGGTLTCLNSTVTLNVASSGSIVGWTGPNGFSSSLATPSVSLPGIYTVTVEGPNGCTASATAVVDEDKVIPEVSATGGTITCSTTSVTLGVNTSARIVGWSGPGGFTSGLANPTVFNSGTYTVTVQAENGCTATATAVVNEDTVSPTVQATGGSISCAQGSVILSVTTNGSVVGWTGPNGFASSEINPSVSAAGTYTVTVVGTNGCTATASTTVNADNTPPSVSASGGTITCISTQVTLNANSAGTVLGWTGPNGFSSNETSPSVSVAGVYTVTVEGPNGCTATATATVVSDTVSPSVSAAGGTITCQEETVFLSVTTNGTVVSWTGPNGFSSTQANPAVSTPGSYTVTVRGSNGCTATATAQVSGDNTAPSVTANGGVISCNSVSATLSVTTTGTIIGWTGPNGFTSNEASPVVFQSGIYTVTVQGANGCTSTSTATVTGDTTPPTVSAVGGTISCDVAGLSLSLTTNGSVLEWTGPNGFSSTQTNPVVSVPGTYTVTVSAANGCTATATATVIEDNNLPTVSVSGGTITCATTSVTLTANTSALIIGWTGPNGFTSNEANPSVTVPGNYTVTVQGANGCTASATATVSEDATTPSVSATGGVITCSNVSVTLGATSNATIIGWTGPNGFSSNEVSPTVSATGIYTVTVQNASGCTASASAEVTAEVDAPSIQANVTGLITCEGGLATLSATTNGSITSWTGPNGFATAESSPQVSVAGTYTVSVIGSNGCTNSASVVVESESCTPEIKLTKLTNGRNIDNQKAPIVLVGFEEMSVTWTYEVENTGNVDLTNVVVMDDQEGQVCVIPFLAAGATETCTLTGIAERGKYTNVGMATADYNGQTVSDKDTSMYIGVWINVDKTADRSEVCPGEEVNYKLTVRMLGGAEGVEIRNIRVNDSNLPSQLTTSSSEFVSSSDLNNNNMIDFIDNDNDGDSDEEFMWEYALNIFEDNVNVAEDMGDVYFEGEFVGTVMNTDEVLVTVNEELCPCEAPSISIVGGTITCDNPSVQIQLTTDGQNISWTGPNGFTSNVANPTVNASGVYTVTVTNGDCSESASVTIGNDTRAPSVSATGGSISCTASSASLSVSTNGTVVGWTGPNGFTSAQSNPTVSEAGTYVVTVIGSNGCTATATATVIESTDDLSVFATATDASCRSANGRVSIDVSGGQAPYSYSWSNGATSMNIAGLAAGTYTVLVTDANGCSGEASATVSEDGSDIILSIEDISSASCSQGNTGSATVIATGGRAPYTYLWGDGQTTQTAQNLAAGLYTIRVTDRNGCSETATVSIDEIEDCTACIGDRAWEDLNRNGIQETGEQGLGGIIVRLLDRNGDLISSRFTSSDGEYKFENLKAGQYIVEFVTPDGYAITLPQRGSDDELDSDINMATMQSPIISLTNDDCIMNIDAGFYKTASIGDFVWKDLDRDGIQDANEPGVEGVRIELFSLTGNMLASTVTNNEGAYSFVNLPPGDYYIVFGEVANCEYTIADQGDDDSLDSDAGENDGRTTNFSLISGESRTDIDAGLVPLEDECNLVVTFDISDKTCEGNDGSIVATVTGGTAPYAYLWSNGGETAQIENLAAGTYELIVEDANGCWISVETVVRPAQGCNTGDKIDLELIKRVNRSTPQAGESVLFQLTVFNNSNVDATGVDVTDVVPNGFTVVPGSIEGGGQLSGNTIIWSDLEIDALSLFRVSFEAIVLMPEEGRTYKNTAQVTAADQMDVDSTPNNDDGDQSEDDEDYAIAMPEMSDIAIEKTVSDATPQAGDVITYRIRVTNEGAHPITHAEVTDYLPVEYCTLFDNISGNGIFLGDRIIWTDINLLPGESLDLTFTAVVGLQAVGESVLNLAEVTDMDQTDTDSTPDNLDGSPSEDDESSATFTVGEGSADLEIMKDVDKIRVGPNEEVQFAITVLNHGPDAAHGITVEDALPNGYTDIDNISDNGVYFRNGILWNIGELEVGEQVTFTFTAKVVHFLDRECDYRNTAQIVASRTADPNSTPGNDDGDQSENDEDYAEIELVLENGVCAEINTAVFLEGAYNYDVHLMSNKMNRLGYLPGQKPSTFFGTYTDAGQPYDRAPWNHFGSEGDDFVQNGQVVGLNAGYPTSAVDWVLVSLRTDASAESTVGRVAALVHQDGHIEFVEGFNLCSLDPEEDYYIVVEHRNHMIVMSHIQVPIVNGAITYDFRAHNSFAQTLLSDPSIIASSWPHNA